MQECNHPILSLILLAINTLSHTEQYSSLIAMCVFLCRWDKHVVVYGEPDLKRSHPVVIFLANDKHAKSVNVYSEG